MNTIEEKEKCEHCFKVYISKYNLNRHKLSCKAKKADDIKQEKEREIEEKDREIEEKDREIEEKNKELNKKDKEILKLKNYIIKLET